MGAGTQVKRNVGYVTENGGASAAIADGASIDHGLAATPTYVIVTGTVAAEHISVSALEAAHFHVAIKNTAGGAGTNQVIYWRAYV
jgi:hypothetical protein